MTVHWHGLLGRFELGFPYGLAVVLASDGRRLRYSLGQAPPPK